ncbi:hypothetical protein [Bremerella alba]|uniref:Lipoprotein n=1 Tax=Bremerella alba TaxID=980252 RepID=A0A7V8V7V8_9BACT|nr:hypothetical protein [Bremerella alba]MBA2116535.1 hypothetical protein [Bremerella alba]
MNLCKMICGEASGTRLWMLAVVCGVVSFSGCMNDDDAPRYQVSGMVTYAGVPVPSGLVKFEPDVENGGKGPGSYAPIKDGTFRTADRLCAGPMKVTICGFDGIPQEVVQDGQAKMKETRIFDEFPTQIQIKHEDTIVDFDVPQL